MRKKTGRVLLSTSPNKTKKKRMNKRATSKLYLTLEAKSLELTAPIIRVSSPTSTMRIICKHRKRCQDCRICPLTSMLGSTRLEMTTNCKMWARRVPATWSLWELYRGCRRIECNPKKTLKSSRGSSKSFTGIMMDSKRSQKLWKSKEISHSGKASKCASLKTIPTSSTKIISKPKSF